jgi:hypothetical protein
MARLLITRKPYLFNRSPVMPHRDRWLLRDLVIAICLKLAVLAALWWLFFHGTGSPVDSSATVNHFVSASPTPTPQQGEMHAQ